MLGTESRITVMLEPASMDTGILARPKQDAFSFIKNKVNNGEKRTK